MKQQIKKIMFVNLLSREDLFTRYQQVGELTQSKRIHHANEKVSFKELGVIFKGKYISKWKERLAFSFAETFGQQCWSIKREGIPHLVLMGEDWLEEALVSFWDLLIFQIEELTKVHLVKFSKPTKRDGVAFRNEISIHLKRLNESLKVKDALLLDRAILLDEWFKWDKLSDRAINNQIMIKQSPQNANIASQYLIKINND